MSSRKYLAIIGTAGRDKSRPLNRSLWDAMTDDLRGRVDRDDVLVSGGAAWADHLAVHAYLAGWSTELELYLPAPFVDGRFVGAFKNSGATARYYHLQFSDQIGRDTMKDLSKAIEMGAKVSEEPNSYSVQGMFARNAKIAQRATEALAYTFGEGDEPLAGGTLDTWRKLACPKTHVSLLTLELERQAPVVLTRSQRFRMGA